MTLSRSAYNTFISYVHLRHNRFSRKKFGKNALRATKKIYNFQVFSTQLFFNKINFVFTDWRNYRSREFFNGRRIMVYWPKSSRRPADHYYMRVYTYFAATIHLCERFTLSFTSDFRLFSPRCHYDYHTRQPDCITSTLYQVSNQICR